MKHTVSALKKAIVLAVAVTLTSAGAAFAVTKHVSGGVWDYGTNVAIGVAWSSFWHPSRKHATSVMIGASNYSSKCVGSRQKAHIEKWRPPFTSVSYHYRFC
jgi:hypothetical protein